MFKCVLQAELFSDLYRNSSSQVSTAILIVTGLNIATSITTTFGNALILIALYKESSLYPPSKLFLRCLAFSDLSVGLLVQPAAVVTLLSAVYQRWDVCRISYWPWSFFTMIMCFFTLLTSTAISVDRLLALLLGIRYRQVVTIKRARLLLVLFVLASTASYFIRYIDGFTFPLLSGMIWSTCLIVCTYCYARIYLTLQRYIQPQTTPQGQQNGMSPITFLRYKKTVSSALWVFTAMMIFYVPFGLVKFALAFLSKSLSLEIIHYFALTLVYLNSLFNPILYCWKIREVRNAVKEILKNMGFL